MTEVKTMDAPVRYYMCEDCGLKYWPEKGMSHDCAKCGGRLKMVIEGTGEQ